MRLKPMVSVTILLRFIRFKLKNHAAEAGGVHLFSHSLGSDRSVGSTANGVAASARYCSRLCNTEEFEEGGTGSPIRLAASFVIMQSPWRPSPASRWTNRRASS